MRLGLAVLLLLISTSAIAQQQPFEAVVAGHHVVGCFIIPIVTPTVQWFYSDRLISNTTIGGVASGDHRRVFAYLVQSPAAVRIVEIFPNGAQTPIFTGFAQFPQNFDVGTNGRFFVRVETTLAVISPAGALEATYTLPSVPFSSRLAVAADDCTIYYTISGGVIARFDACTGTPLSNFATIGTGIIDLEPLSNG